jgi:peptide deformylase
MIYPTVAYGDPVLKKVAKDIPEGTDIKQLVADMYETMDNANGIGLAAPQIDKSIRLFIIDTSNAEEEEDRQTKKVFVNAEIIEESGEEWAFEEGCLSIPDVHADVIRPEKVLLKYYDEDWNLHEEEFDGMNARVIQHEYDHIEGILFTDYIIGLKKRLLKKKLVNISKGKISTHYRMKFPKL